MDSSRGVRRPPVLDHTRRLTAAAALLVILFLRQPETAAAQPSPHLVPWARASRTSVLATGPEVSGAPAIPPGSVIGEVRVVAKDLFDPDKPGEDSKLFRLANRVHRSTRPEVIERQLLFRPGEVFSPELIAESARLLRQNDYLYDVEIQPVLREDGKVDVEVTTRDVWTLEGGASFSRSGGTNNTSVWLEDTNFLGSGKEVTIQRIGTVDRTSNLVRYRDPNLLGSRVRLTASYADNSDGGRQRFELERPFHSLSSRWTAGVRTFRDERLEQLFTAGKAIEGFEHRHDFLEVFGGLSRGLVNGVARRFRMGFTYSSDEFTASERFPVSESPFKALLQKPQVNVPIPKDRALAYPWISFESVQDGFVVERDLDRIQRSEDVNLGRQLHFLLGLSSPTFGGDGKRWIVQSAASAGWRPAPRQLVLAQLGVSTRWATGEAENLVAGGRVRWYARDFGEHLFFASLGADLAHRLDDEDQLLLGGDSGLRGYPLRYQAGDRRVLLTLEQRFFSRRELFHLVHVGAAVFFDAGQAWFATPPSGRNPQLAAQERRILKDAGIGLRLGSSRSSRGAVLHLDVAFPLDANRSIDRVQWLVSTSETF